MALKDIWQDLIDGESDIVVDDINNIAHSVIEIEDGLGEEIIVDSEMSDTSENPVQNKVVKEYVDDLSDTYATKDELPKWKTLIDVTLTEEQAGVSELLLAIEDVESFVNARQIRIAMSFPVTEEKAANSFWTSIRIKNATGGRYNQTVLSGNNSKGSANATYFTTVSMDMFNFAYNTTQTKSYHSSMQLPTPHYMASANTVKAPMVATAGFNPDTLRQYPPYLNIAFSGNTPPTFEAGAHIFMEVYS